MLGLFIAIMLTKYLIEEVLAWTNYRFVRQQTQQQESESLLSISKQDYDRALGYSRDRFALARWHGAFDLIVLLAFIGCGGFQYVETLAGSIAADIGRPGDVFISGLILFGLLAFANGILSLPFDLFATFVVEERHGFNRQTIAGFFTDYFKATVLAVILGVPLLFALMWAIHTYAETWWLATWGILTLFSLVGIFLYPTVLAPLFNKFSPLPAGELQEGIDKLAQKIGFRSSGVYVMDASRRSSHGNAYFTGLFGAKRIVLFDTLIKELQPDQTIAVLAHELGHFKLNHVRNQLIRGVVTTGLTFWLLSELIKIPGIYSDFFLTAGTPYGTLILLALWMGILQFPLQPISTLISRKNEFAADNFAKAAVGSTKDLRSALLKLRETSKGLPTAHPWFSGFYYSHPPLIERLKVLQ